MIKYLLQLADNALILGHRLGEWCGHAPEMELDIALTNVALDLTGQARSLYQRVAELEGLGKDEDDYAYLRDAWEFRNALLVEQPNGDFAHTILRQFIFDTYNYYLHRALTQSKDEWLAGFAAKSFKEIPITCVSAQNGCFASAMARRSATASCRLPLKTFGPMLANLPRPTKLKKHLLTKVFVLI
jgi:phenylacetate-CoA oxygenase PaaI subunit